MALLCVAPNCRMPGHHADDCKAEPDKPCRGCQPARAADGLRLCWHCTNRLGTNAVAAAELWVELGLVLVGGGVGDEIRQRNPGAGLNLKPAIIEHRTLIRHRLVSWTRLIAEDRGFTLPDGSTGSLGRFVCDSAQWLAAQDFADEASGELAELVSTGRSLRQPSGTRIIEIGPCPRTIADEEDIQWPCKGVVRALLRTEASLLPSAIQCDADDEHTWASHQWRHLGRDIPKKDDQMLRPEPRTLQERLDQTRADYVRDGVKDRFPVAVSVYGAKPVYGEFSQTVEEDDRVTRFGDTAREFVTGFAWSLEVECKLEWSNRLIAVRFGEEKALSYEGNVRTDAASLNGFVWTTRLIGVGELVRHLGREMRSAA